jgi:2-octaprenyl-6-methoxyphenol hydroxylase
MALLPLPAFESAQHRYGLVWTVPEAQLERVMAMDEASVQHELQQRFGRRIGNITHVGKRSSYALGLTQINEHVRSRLAFIGNAAHTLHPVAGQGFNLGLRDVAAMVEVIKTAVSNNKDIGDRQVLNDYAAWRTKDHNTTLVFTDALVRVFSNNFLPLVLARNAGLLAMDLFAPLRTRLTRHAMGYIGKASLLARGLDIQ